MRLYIDVILCSERSDSAS